MLAAVTGGSCEARRLMQNIDNSLIAVLFVKRSGKSATRRGG
jgi:hypothetical protein